MEGTRLVETNRRKQEAEENLYFLRAADSQVKDNSVLLEPETHTKVCFPNV